jgi:hypothetical protein
MVVAHKPELSRDAIAEWVIRHEQLGHIFLWWDELREVIHLTPTNFLDFGQCEYFLSLYGDEVALFLYERESESMVRYLVGQEDF